MALHGTSGERLPGSVAETVAALSRQALAAEADASITVSVAGRPTTILSTSRLALDLDDRQYAAREGPCLEAAAGGSPVDVPDARTEIRWRHYTPFAVRRGSLSSLSLPLDVPDGWTSSLNLYARDPHAFDPPRRRAAVELARHASVATTTLCTADGEVGRLRELEASLESRAVIEQAKGKLMERFDVNADQAFRTLARISMHTNVKLREVAARLVATGRLPGLPDRTASAGRRWRAEARPATRAPYQESTAYGTESRSWPRAVQSGET